MTVLLAGCGDLGTEAGLRFAAAGHRVIGWRRSPAKLPDAIEGVAVDLRNADLPTIPPDVSAVVVAVAADSFSENAYREAYVNGLTNVLSALERDSVVPDRILFVSSTAVYGDAGGGWVDEETTTAPGGFSGSIVREAEVLLQERLAGTPTAAVTLRLGGIYGPGRTRLIETVRSGTASIPEIPRFTNRIHRDDAAAAIVHLLTQADTPSSLYVGVDNDPAQMADVLRFLAAELGEAEPAVGGAGDGRGGNKRCSNARLRHSGFEFTFPTFREGYRDILAGNGVRHP
ncbi:NAD-dependent epimerase/dehydratase family protein [Pseudarthrobacter sp. PS3-L1]|uniref:NAD-dependent epimerase/dehydratase family protein n=1 Tax=Pseudarthrobacter sp. PS3-L1 TaxID=3046207 RepID=UPI0024B8EA4F|nr:NAD-dependent epimerase/dehydratase family protein [Pseudarthrobacter sp. PS3-L1]MDJ0319447.1 NAD-dependent epimerase/dehydratase family protein [Pseudarthrobacter sp. PS3-L1]